MGYEAASDAGQGLGGTAAAAEASEAAAGNRKSRSDRHTEMNKIRLSSTYASYFLDQTDYFLLSFFEEDIRESFKAFWKNNFPKNKGPEASYLQQYVDANALLITLA